MSKNTQNKKIEFPTTSKRYSAIFYDALIVILLLYIANLVYDYTLPDTLLGRLAVFFIPFFIYDVLANTFGITVGQLMTNTRVRRIDNYNEKPNIISQILRSIFKFWAAPISMILTTFSKKQKAIHDTVAKTVVVENTIDKEKIFTNNKY